MAKLFKNTSRICKCLLSSQRQSSYYLFNQHHQNHHLKHHLLPLAPTSHFNHSDFTLINDVFFHLIKSKSLASEAFPHSSTFESPAHSSHFKSSPNPYQLQHNESIYTIRIATGDMRGSETVANIKLKLIGTTGQSRVFNLGDGKGFDRGSLTSVRIPVPNNIGYLRMVWVKKGNVPLTEPKSGWFLEKILVEEPDGKIINFPCMQWLGDAENENISRSRERYLLPSTFGLGEDVVVPVKQPVTVMVSGMVIPHPQKVTDGTRAVNKNNKGYGGEDAYFYAQDIKKEIFGMGVADGVHSWREKGIDSGIYTKTLMNTVYDLIHSGHDDVYSIMKIASRKNESEGLFGSCTCCLLTLNLKSGRLNSANLGDSGFMLIGRRLYRSEYHMIFRTPTQEHEFGRPYQLGHHKHASKPDNAMLESLQVFPEDTIVMGTDGLFDNVFSSHIVKEVEMYRKGNKKGLGPQSLVNRLIYLAHENSVDKCVDSPYARNFTEAFDRTMMGGKPDDITVLVAYVN